MKPLKRYKEQSTKLAGVILWLSFIGWILLFAHVNLYQRFLNPDWTETRLFLENKWQVIGAVILFICMYLILREKFERARAEMLKRRERENDEL